MRSLTATLLRRFGDALLVTLCLHSGERGDVRSADAILHSNPIRRSAAMTNEVTDRHPAQALRRCATTPEESLSAPGEREDVRSADTLSVNFYLCTINRKLRETLRIVKKKDRDGELLC